VWVGSNGGLLPSVMEEGFKPSSLEGGAITRVSVRKRGFTRVSVRKRGLHEFPLSGHIKLITLSSTKQQCYEMELSKVLTALDALSVNFESIREKGKEYQESYEKRISLWMAQAERWAAEARTKLEIQAATMEDENCMDIYEEPKEFRLVRTLDDCFNLIQRMSIEKLFNMGLIRLNELLLESSELFGVDMFSKEYAGKALFEAVTCAELDMIDFLLQDKRIDLREIGHGILLEAIGLGDLKVVDRLLQNDQIDPLSNNYQAVSQALQYEFVDIFDRLTEGHKKEEVLRAIPNCLNYAVGGCHEKVVERLLQVGSWNMEQIFDALKLARRGEVRHGIFLGGAVHDRSYYLEKLQKLDKIILLLNKKIEG